MTVPILVNCMRISQLPMIRENPGEYVETKRPVWDAYTPKKSVVMDLTTGTLTVHSMNIRTLIIGIQTENVMTQKEWSPLHEAEQVISYLRNDKNQRDPKKPFFIMVGMNPPHSPYRSYRLPFP